MREVPFWTTINAPTPNGAINWARLIGLLGIFFISLYTIQARYHRFALRVHIPHRCRCWPGQVGLFGGDIRASAPEQWEIFSRTIFPSDRLPVFPFLCTLLKNPFKILNFISIN